MFNRRVSVGAAVIGAVMVASLTAANACGPYGCGYGGGFAVGVSGGYGYGGYGYGGYGYGGYGHGYAQPYGYGYAQPYYSAPVYTAHTTYYARPAAYAPAYYHSSYQPCCRPGLWDSLFSSHNCCVGQQPYYGSPYADIGWSYGGAQYATPGYVAPYIAPPRPYVRPWVRRSVFYRSYPRYRPHVAYRARVVTRPYHRRYRYYR